jgi:uncharacterized membrane protein
MMKRWATPLLLAAMWAFALAVYPRLPARIPTHWNLHGQVDGWGGRASVFLFPAIATGIVLLVALLPRIDPRRANLERSGDAVRLIAGVTVLVMAWIEGLVLGEALGWGIDAQRGVRGGVGVLLAVIGNYLPRIRSNWFIGIRTPWTLTSERVWRETHRLGGRTFVAAGAVMVLAGFFPSPYADRVAFAAVMVGAAVPVVYSYVAWRREASGRAG